MGEEKKEKKEWQKHYEHWNARQDINERYLDNLDIKLSEILPAFTKHKKGKGVWIDENGQYNRKAFVPSKDNDKQKEIDIAAEAMMDLVRSATNHHFEEVYKTKGLTSSADEHIKNAFDKKWYGINKTMIKKFIEKNKYSLDPASIRDYLTNTTLSRLESELTEAAAEDLFKPEHFPEVYKHLGAHKNGLEEKMLSTLATEKHKPYFIQALQMQRTYGDLTHQHFKEIEKLASQRGDTAYDVALKSTAQYTTEKKKVA